MRRLLTPVVAGLLMLTACGSSDVSEEAASEAPTTTAAPTTAAPTTEAPTTTAAPTTEAPTTEAPTTEAPNNEVSGDSASEYCMLTLAADEVDDNFDAFEDPVALEAYFGELTDLLDQAVLVAPTEIAADLLIVDAGINGVIDEVAAAGYDFSVMVAAVDDTFDAEYDRASDVVDAYDDAVCRVAA